MADYGSEPPTLDLRRLETGGLRAPDVLPELFAPFQVVRAEEATIAWLNRRWFAEQGIEIWNDAVRAQVEAWVLRNFAFVVPCVGHYGPRHTLLADRYGSTDGLSPHGGSGRVATQGCFQVKGIGPTPLVGKGAHDGHSHGCLSLAEALREAIYAEIAVAEFPYGAVPIIAIIDVGSNYSSPDTREKYDQDVRRGLLVRPFVFRPSHIERAPLYDSGNDARLEQLADVRRAKRAYGWWKEQIASGDTRFAVPPRELFHRIGRQIGFGQAHRLFNGGYFSSNLSARGELLDFGNMHWLRRWHRARVLPHAPGFGDEIRIMRKVAHSISFFFQHWDDEQRTVAPQTLVDEVQSAAESERKRQMAHFLGEKLLGGRTLVCAEETYRMESKTCRTYEFGVPVGEGQEESSLASMLSHQRVANGIYLDVSNATLVSAQVERFAGERTVLDRAALIAATRDAVGQSCAKGSASTMRAFMCEKISSGRRYWPEMRPELIPLRHVVKEGSSLVDCVDHTTGRRVVWLKGIWAGNRAYAFESIVPASDSVQRICNSASTWVAEIEVIDTKHFPEAVTIGDANIRVPKFDNAYAKAIYFTGSVGGENS